VEIIHFLDYLPPYGPYSCVQWGDEGDSGIPPILDDGTVNTVRNWFPLDPETGAEYPIIIFINHNFKIIHIAHGSINLNDTNLYINCMLDAM
tara:strand:+ start:169 stop:444 length:276 start_codon:yes stop_codon:yes gene_type:complete